MTELFSCNLRDDVTIEAIEEALMNEEKGKGRALSFFNKEARNSELLQDYSGDDLYHLLDAMTLISEWGNNKQVFQVDDDFIRELLNTDEIFYEKDSWKYLPYKCFYLDISESNELCRDFQCKGIFVKTQFFMSAGKERVMLRAYRVNEERFFGDAYEFGNESDSIGLSKLPDVRYEKVVLNGVTTELESHVQKLAKLLLQILNYLSSVEPDIAVNVQESKLSDNGQPEEATEAPAQEDSEKQTEESVAEEKPSKDIFMQEVPSNVSGDANLSTVSFLGDEYLIAGEDTADFLESNGLNHAKSGKLCVDKEYLYFFGEAFSTDEKISKDSARVYLELTDADGKLVSKYNDGDAENYMIHGIASDKNSLPVVYCGFITAGSTTKSTVEAELGEGSAMDNSTIAYSNGTYTLFIVYNEDNVTDTVALILN